MEQSFHYLLMANQAMVHKKLLGSLRGSGLTLGQPKVLDYLKEHEGCTQKELAAGCHIEAASLTALLTPMENKGMIERRSLNGNRRTFHIYLTESGRELQKQVDEEFFKLEEIVFKGFSEEEQKELMLLFQKVYDNLWNEI